MCALDQGQHAAILGLLQVSLADLGTNVAAEHARPRGANVATVINQAMSTQSQRGPHAQKSRFIAPIPTEQNSNVPLTIPVVEMCVQDRGQCAATQELLQVSHAPPGTHVAATHARHLEAGAAGAGV